jgi:5,10-methylenetetrahydromethanopterin reductase
LDFGVVLQGYPGCAEDAAFAEQHGFRTAGFVETPLLAGDPFVWMALAAKLTNTIKLGTMLMIPELRSAPAAAAGLAAVNSVAPGRVFFGIGSGFTSRQTLGLRQPVAAWKMRDYANQVRDLLAGREVVERIGSKESHIRVKHQEAMRVRPDQRVPIYIAADGPKALQAAGEAADGLIMTLQNVADPADRTQYLRIPSRRCAPSRPKTVAPSRTDMSSTRRKSASSSLASRRSHHERSSRSEHSR